MITILSSIVVEFAKESRPRREHFEERNYGYARRQQEIET